MASPGEPDELAALAEQLPGGLSHQLGQLILGAAHNFNLENPQLDLDFFAPVLGAEDWGELGDSDSDSWQEEEEQEQELTCLADSHVIRRLSYHREEAGVHRCLLPPYPALPAQVTEASP